MLALPFARSPPRRQQRQEAPHSQMQNSESPVGVNLVPQQPISRSDSSDTHHSASGQVHHTEPALAPPIMFTSQPHPPLSNSLLSSSFTSTGSQMALGTEGQHQMMIIDTGSGFQQVPVNAHIASKAADEKRKRNATASHRFRQRRKEKEVGNARNISNLERRIRELEGEKVSLRVERDFYRGERDFFRNVATRTSSQASILPRPLSPRQERTAPNTTINYGCIQSKSCDHSGGRNTRGFSSAPSQGVLMPSKFDTSNRHLPQNPLPSRPFNLSAMC